MPQQLQLAFFSYSRDDSEFAMRLANDLRATGANVWMDQLDIPPGQHWDTAVEDALASCSSLLLVLSASSTASTNVMDEVSFALDEGKAVIPVLYRDCKIPLRLRRLQYIDARADYSRALSALTKLLSTTRPDPTSFGDQERIAALAAVHADEHQPELSHRESVDDAPAEAAQSSPAEADEHGRGTVLALLSGEAFRKGTAWSIGADLLRRMLLQNPGLLPQTACVLLIPYCLFRLGWSAPAYIPRETLWFLFVVGISSRAFSVAFWGPELVLVDICQRSLRNILWGRIFFLALSAMCFAIAWAWLPVGGTGPWFDLPTLGKVGLPVTTLMVLLQCLGTACGLVGMVMYRRKSITSVSAIFGSIGAAFASGLLGGALLSLTTSYIPLLSSGGVARIGTYAVLAAPTIFFAYVLCDRVLLGIAALFIRERESERWKAGGGWLLGFVGLWLCCAVCEMYSRSSIDWTGSGTALLIIFIAGLFIFAAIRMNPQAKRPLSKYLSRAVLVVAYLALAFVLVPLNLLLVRRVASLPDFVPTFWPAPMTILTGAVAHALWVALAYVGGAISISIYRRKRQRVFATKPSGTA
jgi:TIR domain